jgi:dTDP-4-dehydrorhamnose 3,5-epimerase-like enzyme
LKKPTIFTGKTHQDERGKLRFNNDFDTTEIKRIYFIENIDNQYIRAWQGHKVEERWFSVVKGSFEIKLIEINDWNSPDKDSEVITYDLNDENFKILHIPAGYISSIQSKEEVSKLMVMANYALGEIDDEYRFPYNFFTN